MSELRQALAQPPAPTAQQCHCKDRPADQCPGEWEPGCDLGANPAHVQVAQPVQQPGAEPDEFLGLPFNEAKTRILALDAESARGMAISFMIQLGLLQKYAAPAQRQPLPTGLRLAAAFTRSKLVPGGDDYPHLRELLAFAEQALGITAAPAAQKGEKL